MYEHGFLDVPGRTLCFPVYDVETLWYIHVPLCTFIVHSLYIHVHLLVSIQMGCLDIPKLPYTPSYVPPLFLI